MREADAGDAAGTPGAMDGPGEPAGPGARASPGREASGGPSMRRVLVLCTHNSARSQMAEGFLRARAGDRLEVASAGTEATRVHPLAVRAMDEVGIDLRAHESKTVDGLSGQQWDWVITVCDSARERCPVFPGRPARLHWSFDDPSAAGGGEGEQLAVFRRVRDEIAARIQAWLASRP